MKMQVCAMHNNHSVGCYEIVLKIAQGTNGSQLWDSAFAAQAFLEVIIL